MKKLLLLLVVSQAFLCALCQTSNITATITDPDAQTWNNGTYTINFVPTPGVPGPYTWNGGQGFTKQYHGSFSNVGALTVSLPSSNFIAPSGSQWRFTLCPNASFQCVDVVLGVTGGSPNLSTALSSPLPAIRFGAGPSSFGYLDVEVGTPAAPLIPGAFYWNVSNLVSRQWNGTIWQNFSGGGGGSPGGVNTQLQFNNLGNFGGIPNLSVPGFLVGNGTSTTPSFQSNPIYDLRNYACAQDGSTDDTACITHVLSTIGANPATILFTGPTSQESIIYPPNVKVKFELGGQLKPITSTTPLGGAGFVQGTGASNVNTLTSSCSVTLTGITAGNALIFLETHRFTGATIPFGSVTDTQGAGYLQLTQQGYNLPAVNSAWGRANVAGGSVTATITYKDNLGNPKSVANGCILWEISGMGPVIAAETGGSGAETGAGSTTMTALGQFGSPPSIPTTTGSLVIGFGGQQFLNEASCIPGSGYTQPAGSAGYISGGSQPVTGWGFNLCATYKLASPGGNQNPTQTIPVDPLPLGSPWSYTALSVIPSSAVIDVQGPVDAPAQQICTNCLAGQGTLDFTGNTIVDKVFPEWWGAASSAAPATNTPALQAAIIGAYGSNRINGSQANVYNRELHLSGLYNINGTLSANHMNGFNWTCSQRFGCGLNQTATNTSILTTTTGGTYGNFDNMIWSTTASQNISSPLVSLNYTGSPGPDLATQLIHFNRNTFNGNGVATVGLEIAAAGGGAQGSSILNTNNEFENFTEAAYMVGAGSNCVASTLATNAISITVDTSDFQGNPAYAFENFGGGQIKFDNDSFEDGFGTSTQQGVQTGYDICGQTGAAGEYVIVEDSRTESRYFLSGGPYVVRNSFGLDQWFHLSPGVTPGVGAGIEGSFAGGDGVGYNITTSGVWTGAGTEQSPIIATSGNATTLTNTNQSIAGANTIGTFVKLETVTQATTGSTGTLLNVPVSIGTVTGSVTSGTIGVGDTVTQATTSVACKVVAPAPTGTGNLLVQACSGTADSSHVWTDGTTSGTYTPSAAPAFSVASPVMVITAATGSPDATHNWTGGTSAAVLVPSGAPTATANYTSNQWAGYQATITAGTGANQYCVITSNTATVLTCSGGWTTRYPAVVTPTNTLDNTSTYIVEPNWGTQTTNGSAIWAADNKPVGTLSFADGFFVAGLKVTLNPYSVVHGLQVTRSDWANFGGAPADNTWIYDGLDGILAASASGTGAGVVNTNLVRNWGFSRTSITGIKSPSQRFQGTLPICWASGLVGGGTSTSDVCTGVDPNVAAGTKKGRWYIENNSSGSPFFWYFNFDGSTTAPGPITATDFEGTIGTTNASTGTFINLVTFGKNGSTANAKAQVCENTPGSTTLNTGGTTTDTGLNCLPANSVIDAVVYRITTTVTTASNFTIGDASTANRFCTTQSTLVSGTTGTCLAQSGTSAQVQGAAAKIRITTDVNPGAGGIELIVYYHTFTPPTS
jgi:hypothetical protein